MQILDWGLDFLWGNIKLYNSLLGNILPQLHLKYDGFCVILENRIAAENFEKLDKYRIRIKSYAQIESV